ncbi:DUF6562 domain-containing protein [Bacteroides timonensis]|uniref:DUF6562 domain-containing protein n=1 Tax=Bacteroides timonensis TaxID=1470345 RepID=UPI0004B19B57|nr:DUF6562 domain-containing protein [Bacteroides timonensis]
MIKSKLLFLLISLFTLAGCYYKSSYEVIEPPEMTGAIVTISLNSEEVSADIPLNNAHLFWFDLTNKLIRHNYYNSMEELYSAHILLPKGNYTILAILNTGSDFIPPASRTPLPDIDLATFAAWVKTQVENYPHLLTGTLRKELKEGVSHVYIDLEPKAEGIKATNVELLLSIPSPHLPAYQPTRTMSVPALRGVADIYLKGSSKRLTTQRSMLMPTDTEGIYRFDLSLGTGEYDINLWADYTTDAHTDHHYITDNLNLIKTLPRESYIANTDTRDAFSQRITLDTTDGSEAVTMHRPLAKYRLVTTDVAKYNELRPKQDWPPLEDLNIEIAYEGFWPNAYSVPNAAPAGAEGGYSYTSAWSEQSETEATAGKDYVFVNGRESFVRVNITFRDSNGKVVSSIGNVQVNYRIGCLTTVQGNFLTASTGGGIHIDTEWSGEYEVEF